LATLPQCRRPGSAYRTIVLIWRKLLSTTTG
jgi:hypothetical protein